MTHFHSSTKATRLLVADQKKVLKLTELPKNLFKSAQHDRSQHMLCLSGTWNCLPMLMLSSVPYKSQNSCYKNTHSGVERAAAALEKIEEATTSLCGEKYVTISMVNPIISILKSEMAAKKAGCKVAAELLDWLDYYFQYLEDNFNWAAGAFLDLRIKEHAFSQPKKHAVPIVKGNVEVDKYKREVPRLEDPLAWWNFNEQVMPEMKRLASKYLCCPATRAPSERCFSKAGELVNQRRATMSDKNIKMILFVNLQDKSNL